MRIGGRNTPSMFRRYNVVDERDLTRTIAALQSLHRPVRLP
jgi:hypothetical protein